MKTTIKEPGSSVGADKWQIWIHLEDGDPLNQDHSFIVGIGETLYSAAVDAIHELEEASASLRELFK